MQKLHVLYRKKYIVEKPSPLVNLPKKTTTHIKALEKEESRNKINFLFFLPSFQPTLSKNQKQRKGKDRKIHLILFSSIKKIFCRSKQNKKKKKEEKMQNDTSPSHLLSRELSFEETGEEKMRETRVQPRRSSSKKISIRIVRERKEENATIQKTRVIPRRGNITKKRRAELPVQYRQTRKMYRVF